MLKKEQVIKGAVLAVLPAITDGLGGFGMPGAKEKEYLLITEVCGGALGIGKSWGVGAGAVLEVIDGPKRRKGINTAIVRVRGQEIHGHIYWCELRASCNVLEPGPSSQP